MEKKKNGLWLYLILVFILSWGFCFGVIYPAVNRGGNYANYAIGLMFFPALSVALTRLITKEGFQNCLLRPRFKGHIRYYLLAWLGPGLLVILGAALYFLLFPAKLDWSAPIVREQMAAVGVPYEAQALPMSTILAIQAVPSLLLAGIANFLPALGEEWGWRGYLYPRLTERFGRRKAALLGGLIWGLWHAPVIALGHNYGLDYPGHPWAGIAAMCVFCIAFGSLHQRRRVPGDPGVRGQRQPLCRAAPHGRHRRRAHPDRGGDHLFPLRSNGAARGGRFRKPAVSMAEGQGLVKRCPPLGRGTGAVDCCRRNWYDRRNKNPEARE